MGGMFQPLVAALLACAAVAAQQPAPSPRLIVLNKDEATLAIVDPATRQVVGRVPTGEAPHEVAVSSDGTRAFVGNYGAQTPGSSISVIDLVAQKELRKIDLGPIRRPHGMAYADGKVYFTAEANRVVARFDSASGQFDWLFGTGQATTHMVLVSADAKRIFTANFGSDSISIIEPAAAGGAWTQTVVGVGKGPEGLDLSPDGHELWTAHSRDGGVSIIDVAAKKVTATLNLQTKRSNRLKFTRDGRRVLITDLDAGELIVVDAATRQQLDRVTLGKSPEGILIAPDGKTAYIAVNGDNYVAILDLASLKETGRIETGKGPDGMAWAQGK
jgi:YVTN family beta-propeller protein